MWLAYAECVDGTAIEQPFPYRENGNYRAECERQYQIECWLIEKAEECGGCLFYSVDYIEEVE